jgi:hypothetical protein
MILAFLFATATQALVIPRVFFFSAIQRLRLSVSSHSGTAPNEHRELAASADRDRRAW